MPESVAIVGAGPGIGASVARRFAQEGLPVGLIARTRATLDATRATMEPDARTAIAVADSTDEAALRAALDAVAAELGPIGVLVYNAGLIQHDAPGDLSTIEHQHAWAVNVVGAITAAAHVFPRMAEQGRGTILLTGGMPEPVHEVVSLSLGKAGLRALTTLLAKRYGPAGVHVATVTVGGTVAPGTPFDPDGIAERYWRLHAQARDGWEHELLVA
jgi:NAD(P)-dependent dehydrogenase (short-subunit alcohol dehydrogenase family)